MVVMVLAIIGLGDAGYLTWQHYAGGIPPCTINGCETVLTSRYATLGPIPVAVLGVGYYAAILAMAALMKAGQPRWRLLLTLTVSAGLVATAGLIYLQGFVIHAWCQYCLLSAGVTTMLFAIIVTHRPPQSITNVTP